MISHHNGSFLFTFIKYGEKKHLQALQQGQMFCNTLQFFAEREEHDGIGDRYEDVYKITYGLGAEIDPRKDHDANIEMIRQSDGNYLCLFRRQNFFANYFCMYSVLGDTDFEEQTTQLLNGAMKCYSHMLIILKPIEFLKRIDKALTDANVTRPQKDFIKYVDLRNRRGLKSYFEKPSHYSSQNEFRIGFLNNIRKEVFIEIGDISDISAIHSIDEVKRLRFFKKPEDSTKHLLQISERHFKKCQESVQRYNQLLKERKGQSNPDSINAITAAFEEAKKDEEKYAEFFFNLKFE